MLPLVFICSSLILQNLWSELVNIGIVTFRNDKFKGKAVIQIYFLKLSAGACR